MTDLPNASDLVRRKREKPKYEKKELTQEEIEQQANQLWADIAHKVGDHFSHSTCAMVLETPKIHKKAIEFAAERDYAPRGYKVEPKWNREDGQCVRVSLL